MREYLVIAYPAGKRVAVWMAAKTIGEILKDVAAIGGKIVNSREVKENGSTRREEG